MTFRLSLIRLLARTLDGRQFSGKGRLLESLCPRVGTVERCIFGVRAQLDLSDHIQRWMFLGTYEVAPARLVHRYLQPGMVVVDVGANVGYYTMLALSRVGLQGRVVAIEPAPRPRARLRAAVGAFPQVTILDCALGAQPGTGTLYLDRERDNDTPTMVPNSGGIPERVPIATLDACLGELGIDHVDLLKLDVEGWEPQILAGARSALAAGNIRAILCELNDYWLREVGTSSGALHRQLINAGFRDATPYSLGPLETRLFLRDPAVDQAMGP